MDYKMKKSTKGFTLVELAIVLVIIGLIVSGVFVGQDLIKAAELRSTVRQLQSFQVGVNAFIGKYGGIPGDVNNGGKFGLAGTASQQDGTTGAGDANGIITEDTSASAITTLDGEMGTFWSHLTTPGKELIKGQYNGDLCTLSAPGGGAADAAKCYHSQDYPKLPFGSTGWIVYGVAGVNYFQTGRVDGVNELTNLTTDFVPIDAFAIDDKIDDGVPTTGDVQARNGHATLANSVAEAGAFTTFTNAGITAVDCENTTPTPDEYQFTATAVECTLRFKMDTF